MSNDELDAYIAAAARVLSLRIEPGGQSAVRMNLAVTLQLAELVSQFPLPDDAEPASVFRA
jgi:Protein of unknown function (DUF4089)